MTEVKCEIVGDRIATRATSRFPGDLDMARSIPGRRWDKDNKYWHYPLTLVTCRTLREVYSDMLQVGPNLTRWAQNEISKTAYLEDFAKKQDTELLRIPEIAPRLDAAMASRKYQRVGARFLAMSRNCLLADEPTLGKTIQYLGGIIEGGNEKGSHLVIAPKSSLKTVWADEVFKWTDFHAFWAPEGKAKRERMLSLFLEDEHPSKFMIVNPEMLQVKLQPFCRKCGTFMTDFYRLDDRKQGWPDEHYQDAHPDPKPKIYKQDWPELFQVEWSSICIDEAHNSILGNRGAKKTQAAEGFSRLRTVPNGMRIASTGTPLKGRPMNFWSIFNWLDEKAYSSKWAWAESFLDISDNGFGKTIGDIRPEREAALVESLRPLMLRRTKREVQPDLPEDLTLNHWVDMPDKHAAYYNAITDEGELEIDGGSMSIQGVLAQYTRQKQFAFGPWRVLGGKMVPDVGSPKADLLFELLRKRGVAGKADEQFKLEGGGFKYIIGSQFTSVLDALDNWLWQDGIMSHKITGAVTAKKREEVQRDWQNNPDGPRVLLVNTKAGGTALTLDAMCDEMFILDETWVDDDQFQLEGRIRNRDVEKRVAVRTYHYIRTRGTIEEEIAQSGLTQNEFQKTILDRSRGLKVKTKEINQ